MMFVPLLFASCLLIQESSRSLSCASWSGSWAQKPLGEYFCEPLYSRAVRRLFLLPRLSLLCSAFSRGECSAGAWSTWKCLLQASSQLLTAAWDRAEGGFCQQIFSQD